MKSTETQPCERCKGSGTVYHDTDGIEHPVFEGEFVTYPTHACPSCLGMGRTEQSPPTT